MNDLQYTKREVMKVVERELQARLSTVKNREASEKQAQMIRDWFEKQDENFWLNEIGHSRAVIGADLFKMAVRSIQAEMAAQ